MTTRQEIRRQQQAAAPRENNQPRRLRQPMRVFWGVIALTLLGVALLFNQTVLNRHFAEQEIQRSNVAATVNNNLNEVAGKYGINDGALDEGTTNKLLKQAVDQIYAGKQLDLDFSSAIKNSTNGVSPSVDGIQIPKGLLSSSIGSEATAGISSSLNQQINTPEVQRFTSILQIWKNVNNIIMIISAIILVVALVVLIIGRASWGSFMRLVGIPAVLLAIITWLIKTGIVAVGRSFPDYSALLVQVANDIAAVGFHYCLALAVVIILLIVIKIITSRMGRRI
ncbi:hypothetical protein FD27_GL001567 [Limosilactobacillus frumenti DSM 13145]|uniref:Uncharacterized protein n=1 Tax=Limosilactobacillus frumenti DSM 13145 TaxID=1423746 RepID=A0A0R1P8M6_9LACO|nr:hypothetical protein [Limosilactobacillus frumenti]KRL28569.1 hypothetical protein FD27_GL001567 [Limosilactobacillus frumenti DSM 13145]MBA2914519.1 hypothetical protein [Limosilactobacillus frumenti]QFG72361.1 hypothetical protein LF145_02870 [Limosilactobacillus frumenti]